MSRGSSFDSAQGGALLRIEGLGARTAHGAPNAAEEIRRARRAVALQTLPREGRTPLSAGEVRELLAMLGIDRAPIDRAPER